MSSTSPTTKRMQAAIVKRCLMSFKALGGFSKMFSSDRNDSLSSEISDTPIIVNCEKKAIPIMSVATA